MLYLIVVDKHSTTISAADVKHKGVAIELVKAMAVYAVILHIFVGEECFLLECFQITLDRKSVV